MKVKIFQRRSNYKKDMLRLYAYIYLYSFDLKIILLIYGLILMFFLINVIGLLVFYPFLFKLLTISLGIGILGMYLFGIIMILKERRKIDRQLKDMYEGEVVFMFNENEIIINPQVHDNNYKIQWSELKTIKVINNCLYIRPKNKVGLKINRGEIIKGDFNEIIQFSKKALSKN